MSSEDIKKDKTNPSKKELPKIKQYFTIKVETHGPITLTYRVFAEDENEAFELLKKNPNQTMVEPPKHNIAKLRRLKATVYQIGSSIIKLVKNF